MVLMVDAVVGVVVPAVVGSVANNCATPSKKLPGCGKSPAGIVVVADWLMFGFYATTFGWAGLVVTGLRGLMV